MYRQITAQGLLRLAPHLANELTAFQCWEQVRAYAQGLYGPTAQSIEFETEGEYNDEGGTDYYITSVTVYDANREELSIDYHGSYFRAITPSWYDDPFNPNDYLDEDERDREERDFFRDLWGEVLPNGNDIANVYRLDTPPRVALPLLYLQEGGDDGASTLSCPE